MPGAESPKPLSPAALPSAFELERLERIKRNRERLKELDVLQAKEQLAQAAEKAPQGRSRRGGAAAAADGEENAAPGAVRRSTRQRRAPGEAAPNPSGEGYDEDAVDEEFEKERKAKRRAVAEKVASKMTEEDDAKLMEHNMNRLNSMSESALSTRIRRITNVAKLKSFITVLEAAGQAQLLAQAQARLVELVGE